MLHKPNPFKLSYDLLTYWSTEGELRAEGARSYQSSHAAESRDRDPASSWVVIGAPANDERISGR